MIKDKICFKRDELVICIPVFNSNETESFILDMNFSTGFFIRFQTALEEYHGDIHELEKMDILKNIAVDILNLDRSKNITILDIENKFNNYSTLYFLFVKCAEQAQKIMPEDLFSVPDIQLKQSNEISLAEQKVNEIDKDIEFMESVTLLMENTNSSYEDIMKMPFTVFQATLKHFKIGRLMQNKEWREAYFKEKYKEELKKHNQELNEKPEKKIKPNIDKLKRLGVFING
ncbi:MAG: hypothetical protein Q4F21_10350 [Lachnospiraceae bacterium]|nr:hypothetical protein [Lachnospiraceae bacterium]